MTQFKHLIEHPAFLLSYTFSGNIQCVTVKPKTTYELVSTKLSSKHGKEQTEPGMALKAELKNTDWVTVQGELGEI